MSKLGKVEMIVDSDRSMVAMLPTEDVREMFLQQLGSQSKRGPSRAPYRAPKQHSQRQRQPQGKVSRHRHRHQGHRHQASPSRPRPQVSHDFVPMWEGFQLIGDSMLSRFASSLTTAKPTVNSVGAKQLGLCVHGQTSSQLARLLKRNDCPKIGDKVIFLLGTNDILKRVPQEISEKSLQEVITVLSTKCQNIIVMTVPPIPKVQDQSAVVSINNFLKTIPAKVPKVEVVDLATIHYNQSDINRTMFDRDRIHWSQYGISKVAEQLKEHILLTPTSMETSV